MIKRFLIFLRANFFTGILIILPVILTVAILRFIIIKLNLMLLNPILNYLVPYLPTEHLRIILGKAIIFIGVVLIVVLIGVAARIFIIRKTFIFFEKILYKLPMVNKIYSTIKEISNAFLGKGMGIFKKVALIEYPRKGIYSIVFLTSEVKGEPSKRANKELMSAYLPTTPNPTSGIFLLIPKEEIMPLNMSVEEGMKMVISSGIIFKQNI